MQLCCFLVWEHIEKRSCAIDYSAHPGKDLLIHSDYTAASYASYIAAVTLAWLQLPKYVLLWLGVAHQVTAMQPGPRPSKSRSTAKPVGECGPVAALIADDSRRHFHRA
jgi:hypothetical protein